jgi:hypothetical protein
MATLYAPRIVTDGLVLSLDAADGFSYASSTLDVEYLIVGGGGSGGVGSGGNAGGGGGGAGGLVLGKTTLTTFSHSVVIGAGGAGFTTTANTDSAKGNNGGNSSVFGITATGGGGGKSAYGNATTNAALGGGSGAGGANDGTTLRGDSVAGQGNIGGIGISGTGFGGGGGGGGATEAGLSGVGSSSANSNNIGGKGGDGILLNLTGNGVYYAGGGGGGQGASGTGFALGGIGGGGRGSNPGQVTGGSTGGATAGGVNTGGGGGGGPTRSGSNANGAPAGGSGIVIIRYRGPQRASGGTVTTSNGWTIHTFTASGTFTVGSHIGDLSGNGNNGQLVNGPTFDSSNLGSLVFDGIDDYVTCGNDTSINIGTGDVTISIWYKRFTNATTNLRLFAKGAGSDTTVGYALFGSNTNLQFIITDGPNPRKSISMGDLTVDTWYNVSAVIDRLNNSSILYRNGVFVTNRNDLTPTDLSGSSILYIGANVPGSVLWDGVVAQFLYYNRALTPQEVLQNYNATKGRYGL